MAAPKVTTPLGYASAGDQIHVRETGFTMFGTVWRRGQEITLTEEHIRGSLDRLGSSFLDREIARPDGRVQSGPWPGGNLWSPGTPEEEVAREQARKAAWAEPHPDKRAAALQQVIETFGPPRPTSRTLGIGSSNARLVEEQKARYAAQGRYVTKSMTLRPEE